MRRKALYAAGVLALLVALYAAFGYWLAPRLLENALEERAAAQGLDLAMEELRIDPFALTADLAGVVLTGAQGERLAAAQALHLDLAWSSLWRRTWIVQRATLEAPAVELVLGPEARPVSWPLPAASAEEQAAPSFHVHALSVIDGALHFVDRSRAEPVEVTLRDIALQMQALRLQEEAQYKVTASIASGGTLASQGTLSVTPFTIHGALELTDASLAKVWRLSAPATEPAEGLLTGRTKFAYRDGEFAFLDLAADATGVAYQGFELAKLSAETPRLPIPLRQPISLQASAQLEPSGAAALEGTLQPAPFSADVDVQLISVPLELVERFVPEGTVDIASGALSAQGRLHLDPQGKGPILAYQGSATLSELRLEPPESDELLLAWHKAHAEALALQIEPTAVTIGELTVQAPEGRLVIEEDGSLNLSSLLPGGKKEERDSSNVAIARLKLENGTLHVVDRTRSEPFALTLNELSGTLAEFSTAEDDKAAQVALSGSLSRGGKFRVKGSARRKPLSAELQAEVASIPLPMVQPYLPASWSVDVASGVLSASGRIEVDGTRARPLASYTGEAAVSDLRLEADPQTPLLSWKRAQAEALELNIAPTAVAVGKLQVQAPEGRLVIGEDRALQLHPLAKKEEGSAKEAASAEGEDVPVAIGRLTLENGTLHVVDRTRAEDLRVTLTNLSGTLADFSTVEDDPARVALSGRLAKAEGSFSLEGRVWPEPPAAKLQVELSSIPLPMVQPYLPDSVRVDIASGVLNAKGRVEVDATGEGPLASYAGSAAVSDLRLEEGDSQNLLLAWKNARTESFRLELNPTGVAIGELVVEAPEGNLIIEPGGAVNFAAAFQGTKEPPREDEAQPFHASLERLAIRQGTLHFADRSLATPFKVTITGLSGAVSGFSTDAGDPALVQLSGRVGKYGSARIEGTIDLDDPTTLADITARLQNLDLAQLTPYVAKFAGYRVRSGRLSARLDYEVREGRLVGTNELVFRRLELGEKVQREGAADLPLELAVALLADAEGRINLDIPVRGDLRDPQFDFGGLVARALRNVVAKVVTAPFRVLAALLKGGRGGEDLGEVRFAAGSARLSPPAEENVALVAKALAERPGLGVTVRGGYDPQRDPEALRLAAVRREVARRAGYAGPAALDLTDPKALAAAERLFLERAGNRPELQALMDRPGYADNLLQALAAKVQIDSRTAVDLARARAEAVRAELVAQGVDPQRVALQDAAEAEAEDAGVPTELALTADRAPAATGGTRR